jgi:SnoaL-like protein
MLKTADVSLMAALLSVLATTAVADDVQLLRAAQDRAAIEALMWRYERALDTLDVDAYVAVFTDNAQFGNAKGRDAIRALISGIKSAREKNTEAGKPVTPTYQSVNNMTIEFLSADRARIEGYYTAFLDAQGDKPARLATVGHEVDEVVRVDGRWLIDKRTVSP